MADRAWIVLGMLVPVAASQAAQAPFLRALAGKSPAPAYQRPTSSDSRSAADVQRPIRTVLLVQQASGAPSQRAGRAERSSVEAGTAAAHRRRVAQYFVALNRPPEVRVDVELANVPVGDALRRLFELARQNYLVDGALPGDVRVSLSARQVRLTSALQVVTDAAGLSWTYEGGGTKPGRFRIGKSVAPSLATALLQTSGVPVRLPQAPGQRAPEVEPTRLTVPVGEIRATFTCPHCRHRTTILQRQDSDRCVRCSRQLQPGWIFCPSDGVRRPSPLPDWKFCPSCGKPVRTERSGMDPSDLWELDPDGEAMPDDSRLPAERMPQVGAGPTALEERGDGFGQWSPAPAPEPFQQHHDTSPDMAAPPPPEP